jgi:hypothetical protein
MSDQTNATTEDIAKKDINDFLKVYRNALTGTNSIDDYLILINGGVIKGQSTMGFLALKAKIHNLMKLTSDNNSIALNYIQNYQNNIS